MNMLDNEGETGDQPSSDVPEVAAAEENQVGADRVAAQEAAEKLGQEEQQQQSGEQSEQEQQQQGARASLLFRLCGRTFGGRA